MGPDEPSFTAMPAETSPNEVHSKKPHDVARLRPKQWRPLGPNATPRTAGMETSRPQSTAPKRVIRTYSKRDNSASSSPVPPPGRPVKKQRMDSSQELPALPTAPAAAPQRQTGRKAHATIDGYFFSTAPTSSSSASARAGIAPSDGVPGTSDGASDISLSSSPPARRWTSPRKLKFRPSLVPILANGEQSAGLQGVTVQEMGTGHGPEDVTQASATDRDQLLCSKLRRGQRLRSESAVEPTEDADPRSVGCVGGHAHQRPRPAQGVRQPGDRNVSGRDKPNVTRDNSGIEAVPGSHTQQSRPTSKTTASQTHQNDRTSPNSSVPNYTMPFSFYVAAAAAASPDLKPPLPTGKKAAATRKIQTTLNLSTKQPFKECKLCDIVYNPLHAADVKLHQTRHARMLGGGESKEKEVLTKGKRGRRKIGTLTKHV